MVKETGNNPKIRIGKLENGSLCGVDTQLSLGSLWIGQKVPINDSVHSDKLQVIRSLGGLDVSSTVNSLTLRSSYVRNNLLVTTEYKWSQNHHFLSLYPKLTTPKRVLWTLTH